MNRALWIALVITLVVILAHIALFVVFLRDPKKPGDSKSGEEDPDGKT